MRHFALLSALVISQATFALAQNTQGPTPQPGQIDSKAPENVNKNTEAIYGKIKTVTAGDKIVVDVDKGRDRTYNLADPKVAVRVAEGLAIGDSVKILEGKTKGNRTIDIVRNTDGGGEQRSRTADQK